MADWFDVGSALFGTGASALSSMINFASAKKLQKHQYELNLKTLENAPTSSRKGFVDAGFNPLLSLGSNQVGFSANSSGVGADLTSGMSQGISSAMAIKQGNAQVKNIQADTTLKGAQADTEKARQIQMDFENLKTDVQTQLGRKDLEYYDREHLQGLQEQIRRIENLRANSALAIADAEAKKDIAKATMINARTNSAVGASQEWRNYNASLGYSSSGRLGPFSFSHTGNPNFYTQYSNDDYQGRYHYETETVRGKKVRVKVYD